MFPVALLLLEFLLAAWITTRAWRRGWGIRAAIPFGWAVGATLLFLDSGQAPDLYLTGVLLPLGFAGVWAVLALRTRTREWLRRL